MFFFFVWPDASSNPGESQVPTFLGTQLVDELVENIADYCFLQLNQQLQFYSGIKMKFEMIIAA